MPQGHHHHENKRDKRNERLMRMSQNERGVQVMDRPLPLIDIGIDRISEIIKSITGENEDTFQDAWLLVMGDHCKTEDDIRNCAIQAKTSPQYIHNYADLSLQKPLNSDYEKPLTIEEVIKSPEILFDEKEEHHTRRKSKSDYSESYKHKQGLDAEIIRELNNKYPSESLNTAIRMSLGLSVKPTKYWKQAELKYLKDNYSDTSIEAIALHLGRSVPAVQCKACEIKLKKEKGCRRTPKDCFNKTDIANIFHFRKYQLEHVFSSGYLHWQKYKRLIIVHRKDIIEFIKNYAFEYRHDVIESGWKSYVPIWVWDWVTIEQAGEILHWSHFTIRRAIKQGDVPVKYYCSHNHCVAFVNPESVKNLLDTNEVQPYKVGLLGEKRHYCYSNKDGDLVSACSPNGQVLPLVAMAKYGFKPYVKGYPTCLRCLKILEKYRCLKKVN